jgi:hypothetical protein
VGAVYVLLRSHRDEKSWGRLMTLISRIVKTVGENNVYIGPE